MTVKKTPVEHLCFVTATWFYSGLFPKAPGTAGTIASLPLWIALAQWRVDPFIRLGLSVLIFAVGWAVANVAARLLGDDDPKEVVIDEVAGQGVALCFATSLPGYVVGFLLFRLFDILKPPPVGWADQKLHGGLGIMLDDMLAGAMALAGVFAFEYWVNPLLGWS